MKDKAHADGSKYTQPLLSQNAIVKVDSYTQGIHLLTIFCAPKPIAFSFTIYRMLTPLPVDRGKEVSSLFPSCPACPSTASWTCPSRSLCQDLHLCLLLHLMHFKNAALMWFSLSYCLWGVTDKSMGSDNICKLHHAHALASLSEFLHPDPSWM